jgi:hypothetical protein
MYENMDVGTNPSRRIIAILCHREPRDIQRPRVQMSHIRKEKGGTWTRSEQENAEIYTRLDCVRS